MYLKDRFNQPDRLKAKAPAPVSFDWSSTWHSWVETSERFENNTHFPGVDILHLQAACLISVLMSQIGFELCFACYNKPYEAAFRI